MKRHLFPAREHKGPLVLANNNENIGMITNWANRRVVTRYIFYRWSRNFTQVFDPWFQTWWEFWSLIRQNFVDPERLILDTMKNTADPDPGGRYPRSRGCDPGSHPFFGPWSLIPYTSLRPCNQYSKLLNVLSYMGNGVDIKFPHHFIACQLCKDQWLLNVVILIARNVGRNY